MTRPSTLAALLCCAAGSPVGASDFASAAPACRFTYQENFCGGGAPVISSTPHSTPAECCAKCTADASCHSWTVNNASGVVPPSVCYLKNFVVR